MSVPLMPTAHRYLSHRAQELNFCQHKSEPRTAKLHRAQGLLFRETPSPRRRTVRLLPYSRLITSPTIPYWATCIRVYQTREFSLYDQ